MTVRLELAMPAELETIAKNWMFPREGRPS